MRNKATRPRNRSFYSTATPNSWFSFSRVLPAHVWRAALAGCLAVDYTAHLGQIQVPTLILRGDQDTVFSRAAQDRLVNGITRAVLKGYPETGHAIHWERPEQVVHDMREFIT